MSERNRPDSPFPHQWNLPLERKKNNYQLDPIKEKKENYIYINSSNGYLDKRTSRLSVEILNLQRKVDLLTNLVKLLGKKLNLSEEELEKYL